MEQGPPLQLVKKYNCDHLNDVIMQLCDRDDNDEQLIFNKKQVLPLIPVQKPPIDRKLGHIKLLMLLVRKYFKVYFSRNRLLLLFQVSLVLRNLLRD